MGKRKDKPPEDGQASKATGKSSSLVDTRVIYCGDNLEQLPKLPPACIDLIYIDPPFNSNRNYEVFWGESKETRAFDDRHANTQAYIDYMRPRCVELARVLKPTGSFYYHCDWHASHYVKVMLDSIFGENNFRNEIVWKRSDTHNDAKGQFPVVNDSIFLYAGVEGAVFHPQFTAYQSQTMRDWYQFLEMPDGSIRKMTKDERETQVIPEGARRFNADNMTSPNPRPNMMYEYKGYPYPPKGWRYSRETMEELDKKGLLLFPKEPTGRIMRKRYLDEQKGVVVGNVWTDIPQLRGSDVERLGYPTQKPVALLHRIIEASSNPNDIVLDAFCGCGTALVAAENLNRQWIGIDTSPTACRVMSKRLRDVCHIKENEALWQNHREHAFVLRDLPWLESTLRKLPPFEFENWAVIALGGITNKAQVGDKGIDGRIYLTSAMPGTRGEEAGELGFMDVWYPVQVKQKDKAGRPDIDAFETAMMRAKRTKGFFVAFDYSQDAIEEIGQFFIREHKVIIPLTVKEILDRDIARKLV